MHTEKNHPENLSQFETNVCEPCDICEETFTSKTKMWLHKIESHGFDYPYKCTKCGEGFVRMDLKKGHMRICDGQVVSVGHNWTRDSKSEANTSKDNDAHKKEEEAEPNEYDSNHEEPPQSNQEYSNTPTYPSYHYDGSHSNLNNFFPSHPIFGGLPLLPPPKFEKQDYGNEENMGNYHKL